MDFIVLGSSLLPSGSSEWSVLAMPPSTRETQGLWQAAGGVFLADPDFEALQNKNVELLLVLTDDWISKLIMQ